ncbi:SPOR domain-containing protein [Mameliella sediminis]|uniref:SPOR domain-containing protein n=1 Tax=Mameliella sediminis TaxID=2836866 RepID=UPI001C4437B8|nr:SPOR domain-containing protein [Mameliella sediminis]MBY6114486.1 SPOR domain-containing protein [Antarctobacter heliothermus]MBY6144059.1 SPOR domain-containing protein [Mameliella alba]MBV7393033.1 SPOR domain-containing protein [Mameliella sediminis]MBY6161650.1 SPOR domain-containing protein [Mameliella alba]MBY6169884.1 SPOR domain-containing protein [Mameliella alba]
MADFTYEGAPAAPVSIKMASVANWAGAAVSLALIAGIAVWGYRVVARDVSGVPIVQAMSGPMREAPKDPGGTLADHQGLAVNAVAGSGAAADPADRLMLAPRPAGLQAEDVALGVLKPVPQADPKPALARNAEIVALQPQGAPIPESADPVDSGPLAALADEIASRSKPLSPLAPGTDAEVVTALAKALPDVGSAVDKERYTGPGLARSLRPRLRPAGLSSTARPVAAVAAAVASAPVTEIDPATLPAGTRLVQIGAFDSPDAARSEWDRLDGRFGDYLAGKDRVIQKAASGGRTFYRLRAHGFVDLSDARRFCAAFVAQKVDCIPVVTR